MGEVEQDCVCHGSILYGAAIYAKGLCAIAGCPFEDALCGEKFGITCNFCKQCCKFHLFPHIKVIVGTCAICGKGYSGSALYGKLVRESAAAKFHIRAGAMRNSYASAGKDIPLLFIYVHAVRCNNILSKHAQPLQISYRGCPEIFERVCYLGLCLGNVYVQLKAILP